MKINKKSVRQLDDFLLEKDKYYLLLFITSLGFSFLYSDLESYLMGRIDNKLPIWIWCRDNLSDEKLLELYSDLDNLLVSGKNEITCSKYLYNKLIDRYNISDYFEVGYLTCYEPIMPKDTGDIFVADKDDRDSLFKYFKDNNRESDNFELSDQENYRELDGYISNHSLYLLKDSNNNILSMCAYTLLDNMAKLTRVYTPKEYRRNGYCEWLVYNITSGLIELGYKVMLYANHNYIPSMSAYKRIGYVEEDVLITFNINK